MKRQCRMGWVIRERGIVDVEGMADELESADDLPPIAEFLKNMSASADVLALAKVEVDLASVPEGKNVSRPVLPGSSGIV